MFTMTLFTIGTQAKSVMKMFTQMLRRNFDMRTGHVLSSEGKLELFREDVTHCTLQEELDDMYMGTDVRMHAYCLLYYDE
jgi:hypothetical protein